jgi:sugar lactone lactonase YvrE
MNRIGHLARWAVALALVVGGIGGGTSRAEVIVETYALIPQVPLGLSFGASGELFVGSSATQGADTDPSWVFRVGPGGSTVTTYGNRRISDPDAIFFDATGALSGQAGTVIVGGLAPWNGVENRGTLSLIRPDGTIDEFTRPSFHNPVQFAADSTGRLLFTDQGEERSGIFASKFGESPPTRFIPYGGQIRPFGLAVGEGDLIYSSSSDGVVRVFNPDGTLLDGAFATLFDPTGLPPGGRQTFLAFAPGGMFGTDLYATTSYADQIVRIGPTGETSVILSSLGPIGGMTFGPDGAMYLSDTANLRILRVSLAVVPEPSSVLLASLGGVVVVGWRLRRRTRLHHPE